MRVNEILTEQQLDEIDRRGFLKGIGAAAASAAPMISVAAKLPVAMQPGSPAYEYQRTIRDQIITNVKNKLRQSKLNLALQSDILFKADLEISADGKIKNKKILTKGDINQSPNKKEIAILSNLLSMAIDELGQLPRFTTSNRPNYISLFFQFQAPRNQR